MLISVIIFFNLMGKGVALAEITEKHRDMPLKICFLVFQKRCYSGVSKYIFLVKLEARLLMNFEVSEIFHR